MTLPKINKNLHQNNESTNISWNQALADEKTKLGVCKLLSAKLRAAIKYFRIQMKAWQAFSESSDK